ncbi:hypothetical protein, conserved [Trypanosoma brucei gambiense DAL972]|uniref:Nucleoplasmin-like domain-containing protein n=2 Tax=Trypanosoma brucei TaxID=5691 RepID=C9ZUN9_TRYB9|nr:hypothetical protein, conserved [Trypanosoma brucei gambiense DAL972]RHW71101.1 hypothetical protein DPX39_080012000 [Trypanosoma brucei equiperdum]CBH13127.1 hypothetical protein, conserved [Trypanosoma brucei gambiense DAL972]|eukprot:XP_011775404.1 hypothetical protein, conserved [Trypanosoma brucei gambiense DAL972]
MSLHCFFGLELRPDQVAISPPMPPDSSLVLTHCSLTSIVPGAVTLYAQSHDLPTRLALCTLSADRELYYVPLHHIFSRKVSFTLVPSSTVGRSGEGPTVHLTGYFESDEDRYNADKGDSSDEDRDEEEEDSSDGMEMASRRSRGGEKPKGDGGKPKSSKGKADGNDGGNKRSRIDAGKKGKGN